MNKNANNKAGKPFNLSEGSQDAVNNCKNPQGNNDGKMKVVYSLRRGLQNEV